MQNKCTHSKASRFTASSCTDLAGAHFWIGSKNSWDEWIYVVKTLSSTVFWSSCLHSILIKVTKVARIWAARVFSFLKKRASQGLTVCCFVPTMVCDLPAPLGFYDLFGICLKTWLLSNVNPIDTRAVGKFKNPKG